jgi:hypothetical protein
VGGRTSSASLAGHSHSASKPTTKKIDTKKIADHRCANLNFDL